MSFRITPELYALVLIRPNLLALLLKRGWGGVYFLKETHGTKWMKMSVEFSPRLDLTVTKTPSLENF